MYIKNQDNIELLKKIFSMNYDFHFCVQVSIKFDVKPKTSKSNQTKQNLYHLIQFIVFIIHTSKMSKIMLINDYIKLFVTELWKWTCTYLNEMHPVKFITSLCPSTTNIAIPRIYVRFPQNLLCGVTRTNVHLTMKLNKLNRSFAFSFKQF